MGLPRSLRALRDPHTRLITGFKSALRAGDTAAMSRLIASSRRRLRLSNDHADVLTKALVGRLDDSLTHEQASEALSALAASLPARALSATTWLTLENLARSVGCFVASYSFTRHAQSRMRDSRSPQQQFLAHLHSGDQTGARQVWNRGANNEPFWQEAGHYLWWWSRGESGRFYNSPDQAFVEIVRGHSVTVLGPAPTGLGRDVLGPRSLVARVIMQEVLSWDEAKDPLGGHCDLAYASRETRNWIRDTSRWEQLMVFQAASFRLDGKTDAFPPSPALLRHAHDPRRLMPGGSSPNMVPLMIWDLSRVADTDITLGGTTFFASRTAYTEGNRRLKHTTGKDTDATGSTGELFERCPTFARHNVTENLTLVANLIASGAIKADTETSTVAKMSLLDYLHRLDELYGKDRL